MWRRGLLLGLVAVLTVAGATPAGAAPKLQLSPATGAAGETFTVRGTGFAASDVEIRWGGQSGELLATAAGPDFSVDATVPDVGPNSYPVVAVVREGGSVSTSNAAFQVSPAVQAIPTGGRAAIDAPSRGGGIDGGLPDTTSGVDADPDPPTVTTAPATTTPATTHATVAPAETAAAAVPTTAVAAPDAAVAAVPVSPAGSTGTVAGGAATGEERGAGALSPASTSRSSGAVQSPTLLVAGLGLVVAGAVALLVRARRARGGQYS